MSFQTEELSLDLQGRVLLRLGLAQHPAWGVQCSKRDGYWHIRMECRRGGFRRPPHHRPVPISAGETPVAAEEPDKAPSHRFSASSS